MNLDTQKLHSQKNMTVDSDNYLRTSRDTELTTEIQAGGNLTVDAGQDVNARGSFMSSQNGDLAIRAGQNINLQAGKENSHDAYSLKHKESGLLSSTTTLTRTDDEHETILGTELSGKNISLTADNAIHTEAAQIAADHNVELSAKEIKLGSVAQYDRDQDEKQVKESGLLGNGLGILIGARETKDQASDKYLTQQGTLVGAGGNVNIQGTDKVQITSSEIAAKQGIEIIAPAVTIHGEDNVHEGVRVHEENQSGLSIGLGGKSVAAVESVAQPLRRACDVKDERLKALYAWRAGNNAKNNGKALENLAKGKPDIGLTVGLGASHSENRSEIKEKEYAGSNITARENASLKATEHDLSITGSNVSGQNIHLEAKDDIALKTAKNSSHTEITEHSSNSGISVEYSLGKGAGFSSVNISHNHSDLKGTGEGTTYTGTNIKAGDRLTTKSGKDTEIIGSTASGGKVDMTIGGNLRIETLQDKDTYHETSHSSGFDIDLAKGVRPDYGVSGSRGNMDSDYVSTTNQAGIYAGKEGFHVLTEKNTHLKGAVIASDAEAEKNTLSTGNLSWENIGNKAEYDAKSYGASLNARGGKVSLEPSVSIPLHGDADEKTKSAIAEGRIEVRNQNVDLRNLERNTKKAFNLLDKIFDKDEVKERQEFANLFAQEVNREIGDIAARAHEKAIKEYMLSPKGSPESDKALKEMRKWEDGGINKTALHTVGGALIAGISGGNAISGAVGAGLNEAMQKELKKIKDKGAHEAASMLLGRISSILLGDGDKTGESTAYNNTKYNFLLHEEQVAMAGALRLAISSGSRDAVIKVLAYYAALSSWHIQHANSDDYANMRTDEIIEGNLYGNLANITDPNRYGNSLNPVLNDLVTQIYGQEAADATNLFLMRMNQGNFSHDGFWVPSSYMIDPKPVLTVEGILDAGGQWNERGELVDNQGVVHDEFGGRGDYEWSRGAEIIRYYDNGVAAINVDGNDYPVYSAPREFDTKQEVVKAVVSEVESIKYGLIDDTGKNVIPEYAYKINKGLKIGGGISGAFFSAQDFYYDFNKYHDDFFSLGGAWGTDFIPLVCGLMGGAYGSLPGGVLGSIGGAYIRDVIREKYDIK